MKMRPSRVQCGADNNFHPGVRYAGFGVEFFFAIDRARDLARSDTFDNVWHTFEKLVPFLLNCLRAASG